MIKFDDMKILILFSYLLLWGIGKSCKRRKFHIDVDMAETDPRTNFLILQDEDESLCVDSAVYAEDSSY